MGGILFISGGIGLTWSLFSLDKYKFLCALTGALSVGVISVGATMVYIEAKEEKEVKAKTV